VTRQSEQELILRGFAGLLAAEPPVVKWRDDGSQYEAGETALTFGDLTPSGRCVALTCYDVEDVDRSSRRYWIQARIRTSSDPLDLDLVDDVHDVLAWRRHPPMPSGIDVVQIVPRAFARFGRIGGEFVFSRNFSALT
jgi:hypothetical protein